MKRSIWVVAGLVVTLFLLAVVAFTSGGDRDPVAATESTPPPVEMPEVSTSPVSPESTSEVVGVGAPSTTAPPESTFPLNTRYAEIGADCDAALEPVRAFLAKLQTPEFTAEDAVALQTASDAASAACSSDEWLAYQIAELEPVLAQLAARSAATTVAPMPNTATP